MEQMLAEEGVMQQTQKIVCGGSRMHGLLQQEFEQQHGLDVNEVSDDDDDVKMLTELLLNDFCPDATGIVEKCETFQSWSTPACVQVSANPQHHADASTQSSACFWRTCAGPSHMSIWGGHLRV